MVRIEVGSWDDGNGGLNPLQVGVSNRGRLIVADESKHAVAPPSPIIDVSISERKDATAAMAAGREVVPAPIARG